MSREWTLIVTLCTSLQTQYTAIDDSNNENCLSTCLYINVNNNDQDYTNINIDINTDTNNNNVTNAIDNNNVIIYNNTEKTMETVMTLTITPAMLTIMSTLTITITMF